MWSLNPETKSNIASVALVLGAFCLHVAPAIASISVVLLIVIGLIQCIESNHRQSLWLQAYFMLLLGDMILSDWWSGATLSQSFQGVQVMLPLFFIPSLLHIRIATAHLSRVVLGLAIPIWWLSGATLILYATDYQFLSQMVLESKPLPLYSKVYHIEYSMLTSVVLLILVTYLTIGPKDEHRLFLWALIVLLGLALHVMSARTGLMVFWSGLILLLWFFWGNSTLANRLLRRTWPVMVILPFLLWYGVPSFQNRVRNTQEDLQAVLYHGDLNHKSFGQRVEAWRATTYTIKQQGNWLHGTGTQGFEASLLNAYEAIESSLHTSNRIGPHNQWLQWIATYGWGIGLAWLLGITVTLKYYFKGKLIWVTLLPVLLASMVESIAQRQAGVMACVILWIWMQQFQEEYRNLKKISSIN